MDGFNDSMIISLKAVDLFFLFYYEVQYLALQSLLYIREIKTIYILIVHNSSIYHKHFFNTGSVENSDTYVFNYIVGSTIVAFYSRYFWIRVIYGYKGHFVDHVHILYRCLITSIILLQTPKLMLKNQHTVQMTLNK